jgi:hypothetical protein
MSINIKLSLVTCYYIQKLVRQQAQQLKSVLAAGAGCNAKQETDINKVLESLYLEVEDIAEQTQKLEVLVRWHQTLSKDAQGNQKQLAEIETKIFWIIGLKKLPAPSQQSSLNSITDSVLNELAVLFR